MKRRTKIIATLGPSSTQVNIIKKMAKAGMDIARLNFSHGNHKSHKKMIDTIRKVNKTLSKPIEILQDLEGYRIRIGHLTKTVELQKDKIVWMSSRIDQKRGVLPLDCDFDIKSVKKGMHIFIADGTIDLEVIATQKNKIKLKVLQGGRVSSKKGVNIPALSLGGNIFTVKDQDDIQFGIENKVDYMAQSFVRNKQDINRVVKLVSPVLPKCRIIAKIENKDGIKNIDSIIDACDGVMVARGDLGVSLPIYQVPVLQKRIILRSNHMKKIDITATQMLESMIEHRRPTRAEVSDVANAIIDGSDCVMLSGETAVGQFPVETITMMRQIIEFTEKSIFSR